jgi:hypothetical protein
MRNFMSETPDIKELAKTLSQADVRRIMLEQMNDKAESLQVQIEEQSYSEEEILSKYSENQYVEQKITVGSLTLVLRTVPPMFEEEAIHYANKKSDGNRLVYDRLYLRRRAAYGVISVNGKNINGSGISGSYFDAMKADREKFQKLMEKQADSVMDYLDVNPMITRITEIFATWENVIYNKVHGIEDISSTIKKSTGGSEVAQSRG